MQKVEFNEDWRFRRVGEETWKVVTLPHDAMIGEERKKDNAGGTNTGWFTGYNYEYEKNFYIPKEQQEKQYTFEFEGVYRNAEVFINGVRVAYRPYGYTNFYVNANEYLYWGQENVIRVVAENANQPNSRWYSGAGIYRPVQLYISDKKHILQNGVRIKTLQITPAKIAVNVKTSRDGHVKVKILDDMLVVAEGVAESKYGEAELILEIPDANLWSVENPYLYKCSVEFAEDTEKVCFGIRTIAFSAEEGFCLNGRRVIIRGACVHHDNGILGACSYYEAEERKIRLLKEAGYNAVRSAHNPCSKAMLEACDRLGVMMMDEYVDMWYIHKTRYDYADYVQEWYKQDITDMIEKDYNHPCVIMYSLGNEVAETGQKKGIEFFKKMRAVCKGLDPERPVTVGVNIFFNYLYSLGFGVYSDEKAQKAPQKKVGSEFFNEMAGILGDRFMKTMAMLPGCDRKTKDCFSASDIAGYNYGIKRYKGDIKKYPQRIILGSETFCSDAFEFWEFAKLHNAVIGDFVWAGMDYLGEVGVGSWEYKEYAPEFNHNAGWISAGSGRIDLIGNPLGESLYTKVAFELSDIPQIAVVPVNHTTEKHSPSAWKFSNAIPSWSWNGLDGKTAKVEVYSRAPIVELYINGKQVGRKKFRKNCRFVFKVKYYGGEITAVNLDAGGNELSRNSLKTAKDETVLSVIPEKPVVKKGEICFVKLRYTDSDGLVKPLERKKITVSVEGGELLALGNACPYNSLGYTGNRTDTYYGEAMAIVRMQKDIATVAATDGVLFGSAKLVVK